MHRLICSGRSRLFVVLLVAVGGAASAQDSRSRRHARLFRPQTRPLVSATPHSGHPRIAFFNISESPIRPVQQAAPSVTRWEDLFDEELPPSGPASTVRPDTRPAGTNSVGPSRAPLTPVSFESILNPVRPPITDRSTPVTVDDVFEDATNETPTPAPELIDAAVPHPVTTEPRPTTSKDTDDTQTVSPPMDTHKSGSGVTRPEPAKLKPTVSPARDLNNSPAPTFESLIREPDADAGEPVPKELQTFADKNTTLVGQSRWLRAELEATRQQSAEAKKIGDMLSRHFERARQKHKQTGLTTTLGLILHHEREHLPNIRTWQRERADIKERLRALSEVEFSIERQQADLEEYAAAVKSTLERLAASDPPAQHRIRETGRRLIARHEKLIDAALADAQAYSEELTDFDSHSSTLINTATQFESYINKNVLWIRSTDPIGAADFNAVGPLWAAIGDPADWWAACRSLVYAIGERLPVIGFAALLAALTFGFRRELRKRLRGTAARATADEQVRLLPTLEAVAITTVTALAWPGLIWCIGWALSGSLNATAIAISGGYALQIMAAWYGSFALARGLCQKSGVAQSHFGWRPEPLRAIDRGLPGLMTWGLPLVAVVAFLSTHEHGHWSGSVGRIVFVTGMCVLTHFVRKGLDPVKGFVAQCTKPGSRMHRSRYAMLGVGLAIPVGLAVTSAAGYHHSALQLTRCLQHTWMLGIAIAVAHGVSMRGLDWIIQSFETGKPVARFPFRARVLDPTGEEAAQATAQLELERNRAQVERFLTTAVVVGMILGSWGIWHNVLPALNVVNDVHLWQMGREVAVTTADGTSQVVRQLVWINLGDVIRATMIFIVTIVAARNLPGLLDTLVLRRLPFDRGGRHAISTICRYVLTSVGCILTLKSVGVDWASLQWMVAAMTVGLGFGLQEIFANFVSGLIILLERPVRIGDFVTVNGETGFVTRIQFRATTITDLDRRELLVPNKKFITDELINWTLSDPITRLVVPVGIAYGSDTTEAHRLLLEVAQAHPAVLKEPEPSAVMMSFGDSTLNFELRVFIPRRDEFAQILHELNTAIDLKFRSAKIEIAFPQCDINVRGLEQFAEAALRRAG